MREMTMAFHRRSRAFRVIIIQLVEWSWLKGILKSSVSVVQARRKGQGMVVQQPSKLLSPVHISPSPQHMLGTETPMSHYFEPLLRSWLHKTASMIILRSSN